MPTIKDVAKHCDVSFKTVSNVVNGHPNVSIAMREKVMKAIDEVGYYPSESARRLVHRKKNSDSFGEHYIPAQLQIGCVTDATIDHYGNPFYLNLFHGLETRLTQQNHVLSFVQADKSLIEDPLLYNYFFDKNRIHGIVTFHRFGSFVQRIKQNFSVVSIGQNDVGSDYVAPNVVQATQIALDHLQKLGHQKIAFIGVRYNTPTEQIIRPRYEAYKQWMAKNNIPINEQWIVESNEFDVQGGQAALSQLLKADARPTAIFCASDELAYGVILACRERKMTIPDDFSVMGVDNLSTSQLVYPALTTVEINSEQMGQRAADMLIERIQKPDANQVSYVQPCKLIERDSCRCVTK